MLPDVSVCVVTWQRPEGIARLLESLAGMKCPPALAFEVVVVDNDPDGVDVAPVAREARGRFVAFVDDDEVVHEGWLSAFVSASERHQVDGFFGPVLPHFDDPASRWIDVFFERPRLETGAEVDPWQGRTGNAFLRRALFDDVHFDPAFGRTVGEDADVFVRLGQRGARFLWCDEAVVTEVVSERRRRPRWLLRRALEAGATWGRLRRRQSRMRVPFAALRALALLALASLALPLAALSGRGPALRAGMQAFTQLGKLLGFVGLRIPREAD